MNYNEAHKIATAGQIPDQTDSRLVEMLQACLSMPSANMAFLAELNLISSQVRDEIAQRHAKKKHDELILQQEKLHKAHIEETQNLHRAASLEGKTLHGKAQCVAWLAVIIALVTLVFVILSFLHDLVAEKLSTAKQIVPPSQSASSPAAVLTFLTNSLPTSSVLQTSQPPQITEPTNK